MIGNSNSAIELILNLGIDTDKSKKAIQSAIKNIQKELEGELDVSLKIGNLQSNNKELNNMSKQVSEVISQLQKMNNELDKIGGGSGRGNSSGKPNYLPDTKDDLTSLDDLLNKAKATDSKIKEVFKGDVIDGKYSQIIVSTKDAFDQLTKTVYSAQYGDKGDLLGFKALQTTIDDTKTEQYAKNLSIARKELDELRKQGKITSTELKKLDNDLSQAMNSHEVEQLTAKMKEMNKEASRNLKWDSMKDIKRDAELLLATLDKLGMNRNINLDTSEIRAIQAQLRELSNTRILNDMDLKNATAGLRSLSSEISTITDKANRFASVNQQLESTLDKIANKGTLSQETLSRYRNEIQAISSMDISVTDKVEKLRMTMNALNKEFSETHHVNNMQKNIERAKLEILSLQSALDKTENSYKRTINKQDVANVRSQLEGLTVPNFADQSQADVFMNSLRGIKAEIKQINADATVGARNSMGIIDAFRTAMERFPIWLGASTIFYGITRGIKDLYDKVIELDTAMVNLERVSDSFGYEFNSVIERSVENVSNLSGKMDEYLEIFNEYARTGKTIDESFDLTNTTQMLTNISDLTAKESVDALTASLIAFNLTAEESERVADKLNEVDFISLLL